MWDVTEDMKEQLIRRYFSLTMSSTRLRWAQIPEGLWKVRWSSKSLVTPRPASLTDLGCTGCWLWTRSSTLTWFVIRLCGPPQPNRSRSERADVHFLKGTPVNISVGKHFCFLFFLFRVTVCFRPVFIRLPSPSLKKKAFTFCLHSACNLLLFFLSKVMSLPSRTCLHLFLKLSVYPSAACISL